MEPNGDLKTCVAVNTNDIDHIKNGIDEIKQTLKEGGARMDALDKDVTKLKEQNSIMGRLVSTVVPFVTGLGGVAVGWFAPK